MNLGVKNEEPTPELAAAPKGSAEGGDYRYPTFTLEGDLVDEFQKEQSAQVGDKLTATVRLRVSGMADESYGKRLTFELLSIHAGEDDHPKYDDDDETEVRREESKEEASPEPDQQEQKPKHAKPGIARIID